MYTASISICFLVFMKHTFFVFWIKQLLCMDALVRKSEASKIVWRVPSLSILHPSPSAASFSSLTISELSEIQRHSVEIDTLFSKANMSRLSHHCFIAVCLTGLLLLLPVCCGKCQILIAYFYRTYILNIHDCRNICEGRSIE